MMSEHERFENGVIPRACPTAEDILERMRQQKHDDDRSVLASLMAASDLTLE